MPQALLCLERYLHPRNEKSRIFLCLWRRFLNIDLRHASISGQLLKKDRRANSALFGLIRKREIGLIWGQFEPEIEYGYRIKWLKIEIKSDKSTIVETQPYRYTIKMPIRRIYVRNRRFIRQYRFNTQKGEWRTMLELKRGDVMH